jgi:hypothetical protein
MKKLDLFLLQISGISNFQIRPNPIQGVIFVVGLAAIILLIIYLNKSKKVKNNPIFQTGTIDKADMGVLAVKGMVKIARKYGLDAAEQKALGKALHSASLDIASVFNSTDDIDNGFSRMISAFRREDGYEEIIAKLFAIRNKVDYYVLVNETAKTGKNAVPPRRYYRRQKMNVPVAFYLVLVTEVRQGMKKVKKLSLDKNKLSGTILDLSAGGCSISTHDFIKAGARIKTEFKIGKTSLAALAIILRINKSASGNVLHTRFLKLPVKAANAINALVYNYRDI